MTPLELTPDPTTFESWTAVAALAIMVAGGVAMRWLAVIKADGARTREQVDATSAKVAQVTRTLTENNSGSHVKDQLDRLEKALTEVSAFMAESVADRRTLNERVATLEKRRGLFGRRRSGT
ncbi:MAG: hypothetical protein QM711_06120 [Micropruina sp.]|uniref:hypothetical protein n=1 Tax=Micropruina sp. TaxID=2737536 RepID=UPI0039E41FB5